jgi:hypothetical protein
MRVPSSREGSGAAFASGDVLFHRKRRNGERVRGRGHREVVSHGNLLAVEKGGPESKTARCSAATRAVEDVF